MHYRNGVLLSKYYQFSWLKFIMKEQWAISWRSVSSSLKYLKLIWIFKTNLLLFKYQIYEKLRDAIKIAINILYFLELKSLLKIYNAIRIIHQFNSIDKLFWRDFKKLKKHIKILRYKYQKIFLFEINPLAHFSKAP